MSTERDDGPGTRPAETDDYVANYMPGAGRVLLRDKVTSRKLLALLGAVTLWCGGGAVATLAGALPRSNFGVALMLSMVTAFFALLTVTLTVVRTVVSDGEVHVQYGAWGPRVPVARIKSCRVVPYDWKRFGGFGIKRSADGTWAYVMSMRGDVVELVWTDDGGKERTVLFSASDPRAVAAAIEQARAAAPATKTRVATDAAPARVDEGEVVDAPAQARDQQRQS